jgi:phage-related protein
MLKTQQLKPLFWVDSAKNDLKTFPAEVQDMFGYALYLAQTGSKHLDAKSLKGFWWSGCFGVH